MKHGTRYILLAAFVLLSAYASAQDYKKEMFNPVKTSVT